MLNQLLVIAGVVALAIVERQVRQRLAVRRLRRQAQRFDVTVHGRALDQYWDLVEQTFGAEWIERPPVDVPSEEAGDACLGTAVELAAARFGVPLTTLRWRFVPRTVREGAAGCALGPATHRIEMRGNAAVVTRLPQRDQPWVIEVAEQFRDDPEVIAVIAAHEVAHVALAARGVGLVSSRSNEQLVDVAALLAGFGPIMLRVAGRERVWTTGRKIHMQLGVVGYLGKPAISHLWERRRRIAS